MWFVFTCTHNVPSYCVKAEHLSPGLRIHPALFQTTERTLLFSETRLKSIIIALAAGSSCSPAFSFQSLSFPETAARCPFKDFAFLIYAFIRSNLNWDIPASFHFWPYTIKPGWPSISQAWAGFQPRLEKSRGRAAMQPISQVLRRCFA